MKQIKENTEQIAIYSRKSKFTGKGESIENQIELCKQYIRAHYPNCKDDGILIYEDEGFSGGNTERPEFKRMMAEARAKKFSAIVCYRLDRISRNIGDFAKLIEELDGLKVSFISIKEQFDTSSPMGRAMMYISSVFSQLERETIAERIRDNMHELSKTGRWLGGTSPTGYFSEQVEKVTVDGKTKKACKLQLIPEEAELVKQIYKVFLETNSLTKTETYFIQNGYRTKNKKLFTRFALRNILTNPVYMIADEDAYSYLIENEVDLFAEKEDFDSEHGVMAYNRTIQKSGKANQIRPMDEWIVAVGKHTGLIKGTEWVTVQECLEQNRSKSFRKPRSNVALLSGLLFCTCGDYMRPKLSKRLDAQGEFIYSYLCAMKEKSRSHVCKMKNANGNMLDRVVCEEIKRLGADSSEFIRQLELGKKQLEGNHEEYDDNLERLRGELAENGKKIARLVSSLSEAAGTGAEGHIVKEIDELHGKGEMMKSRIAEIESLTASHALSNIEFDIIRQMLTTFKDTMDDMSVEQKRAALRTFVKKVVWDGENVHVYLFGSDDSGGIELPQDDFLAKSGGLTENEGNTAEPLCENSKCYTNIVAKSDLDYTNRILFHERWHPFICLGNHLYIMTCHCLGGVKYAPLYIHSFQLLQPRRMLEAERFNIKYTDPLAIATVADKLRYYRHKKALRQRDVAEKTGIRLATYCAYEQEDRKIPYPFDKLSKIADLFGVEITDLLDRYNLFLYNGQGQQIRALRQSLGLTKKEFGKLYGFHARTVNQWENDNIQILKSTWVKLFGSE